MRQVCSVEYVFNSALEPIIFYFYLLQKFYQWTVENDTKTLRVDENFLYWQRKRLRFQKRTRMDRAFQIASLLQCSSARF